MMQLNLRGESASQPEWSEGPRETKRPEGSSFLDAHLDERASVLVVDDENGPRQSLRMLLKEECDVAMASSVSDAIAHLDEHHVDVVITDIRMPYRSGIELLREVKQRWPDIEVIILTGYGQLSTAVEAVEHGAFAYLEKPFDNQAMLSKVRASLGRRRRTRERRALEFLALEANRFETIGHMIGGALHDLGTPLSVISSHLELMQVNPEKMATEERLYTLRKQVQHCNDIVRTVMNFLRHSPEERTLVRMNPIVRLCLEFARPLLIQQRVAVFTDLETEALHIEGDPILVRQALLNLINNACQAMEGQPEPQQLRIQTYREKDQICLSVQDSGPGVTAEYCERIFDPLFTTKGTKGTGLGLAVVRNVMERHQGTVSLENCAGRGARFVLRFPPMPPIE